MKLTSFLFPAPEVNYTPQDLEGDVIYVPRYYKFNKTFRNQLSKLSGGNIGRTDDSDKGQEGPQKKSNENVRK